MRKNLNILRSLLIASSLLFAGRARAADFMDYFSGCIMSMGGGLAGTAYANTKLDDGQKISTTGYAISGGISCIAGMAFVGITSSSAEFNATWKLKLDNENLTYQLHRLSKEKCIRTEHCSPEGNAIVIEKAPERKKQGDTVIDVYSETIETNE